jgi:hypothetical protein
MEFHIGKGWVCLSQSAKQCLQITKTYLHRLSYFSWNVYADFLAIYYRYTGLSAKIRRKG